MNGPFVINNLIAQFLLVAGVRGAHLGGDDVGVELVFTQILLASATEVVKFVFGSEGEVSVDVETLSLLLTVQVIIIREAQNSNFIFYLNPIIY